MKIVIIGAGFGGLRLARKLRNKKDIEITLIDRLNYHQFQPLFYQVATSGLNGSDIAFPLRKVFHNSTNVKFRMATVQEILFSQNKVLTNIGPIAYDQLVIATGAGTNFFGNKNMEQHALPMKSTIEAMELRNRILKNFETAVSISDEQERKRLMSIVVVGGGPTGVELAGAIADMRRFVLHKDFPELNFADMKIYLLEGSPKILGAMSAKSSEQSEAYLKKLGVIVKTNTLIDDYDGKQARMKDGSVIESATVIWAAGIKGNIPAGIEPSLIARGNRILVDGQCRVSSFDNVYAIGDVALMQGDPAYPNGHPQVAPVATQMADLLVKHFMLLQKQQPSVKQFSYYDKGAMATIGRNLAVVDIPKPKLHFGGFFAWMVWMFLHLMLILGVKNRFFVFLNWMYAYLTRDQNLRLILDHQQDK